MKIAIIGYSGSGKSTLAKQLSTYYKIPVLFLDKVKFLPNWVDRSLDESRLMVQDFMKNDSWIIDGNYRDFLQRQRLEEATKIIFLDFPRYSCLYRAFKRYCKYKNKTREDMANGCFEKMDFEFVNWILREGRTKEIKSHYDEIKKEFADKMVILRNQKEIDLFVLNIVNS
ncbi:DNA topology modulation protein [Paraclostridium sordellii]|uniref:DNA topology modulation protein n=1 Tax=Paraclostridium sordellii TaxID=1505 RepID=UPI000C79238E|nr:DNA topology modulation protein [Paeniclostridium sordellii]AUN13596.1 DNA topology modulation protein FlaR [Paeniclostridium sordellii]MDU5021342.1 DNA topology modulation protein [Clostridiales bacterium]